MHPDAARLVHELGLTPHPEGGFYREIFRSAIDVERSGEPGEKRAALTLIYFLLPQGSRSVWHSVRSDETWHHLDGAPLELFLMRPEAVETMRLGKNVAAGEVYQHVVPANVLQAAWTTGDFTLVGCAVAPGFEFSEFRMPKRKELLETYPQHAMWIEALTQG